MKHNLYDETALVAASHSQENSAVGDVNAPIQSSKEGMQDPLDDIINDNSIEKSPNIN